MKDSEYFEDDYDLYDDIDEEFEDIEDGEDFIEYDMSDRANLRVSMGLYLLEHASSLDLEDANYIDNIINIYGVDLESAVQYSAKWIQDIYYIGELYLPFLFKTKKDVNKFIITKLKEWQNNRKTMKMTDKNILLHVYHLPNKIVRMLLKYLYTKDKYVKSSLKDKVANILEKIKGKLNSNTFIKEEKRKEFQDIYDDCLNGARATNLNWLMSRNQNEAQEISLDLALEDEDEEFDAFLTLDDETCEIMCNINKAKNILDKQNLTVVDQKELEKIFNYLNNLVVLAKNEYEATK